MDIEEKMKIVIGNYFKAQCDVNTSIREAFEKGFRIGVKKGMDIKPKPQWISTKERLPEDQQRVVIAIKTGYPPSYCHSASVYEEYTPTFGFFWTEGHGRLRMDEVEWWVSLPMPPKTPAEMEGDG